jgi:ATP-dependent DNA ligase
MGKRNLQGQNVEALARLRSRSCIIDGKAVCCDDDGRSSFERIRYRRMTPASSSTPST